VKTVCIFKHIYYFFHETLQRTLHSINVNPSIHSKIFHFYIKLQSMFKHKNDIFCCVLQRLFCKGFCSNLLFRSHRRKTPKQMQRLHGFV